MRLLTKTAAAAALFAGFGAMVASPASAITTGSTGYLSGTVTTATGLASGCVGGSTCNASADGGGYNFTFTMPAFNPALGTLTSIDIKLTATVTGDLSLQNTTGNGIPLNFGNLVGTGFQAFVPNPGGSSPYNPLSASLANAAVTSLSAAPAINLFAAGFSSLTVPANTTLCYQSDGLSNCAATPTLAATLSNSINDANATDLTAALSSWTFSGGVIGNQNQSSQSGVTYNADVYSQETVQVQYNYNLNCGIGDGLTGIPCPTPEPASMTLLGAGLVGLGAVIRRRRKGA